MNTGCEFYADALVDRAAGAADPGRAGQLDAHLAGCAECAAVLRTLTALKAQPLEVPVGLEARVRAAVHEAARPAAVQGVITPALAGRRPSVRWRPWALPLAAAAALVAIWLGVGGPASEEGNGEPSAMALFEEYDPYATWPAGGLFIAGEPLLSELSVEELEYLLQEMES